MGAHSITVVICTFRRHEQVQRAVRSVLNQTLDPRLFRVLVIDNDVAAQPCIGARFLSENLNDDQLTIIQAPSMGVSHARNVGLQNCVSDVIAFLDDDAEAAPDWLEHIRNTFIAGEPEVGVVGGRVLGKWSAERPPWLEDSLLSYLSLIDWGPVQRLTKASEWLAGANVAYRTSLLRAVGGFRTDLGRKGGTLLGNEETFATKAIRSQGYKIVYEPKAVVCHSIANDRLTHAWFRRRVCWQAVSDFLSEEDQGAGEDDGGRGMPIPSDLKLSDLMKETDDPRVTMMQMELLYHMISRLLSAGKLE
jgi:glycosyltransferase involved in cell wall biosynthesis